MYKPYSTLATILSLILSVSLCYATENKNENNTETNNDNNTQTNCSKINFILKPNTIFDESDDDIIFIHRWANAIHIDTKPFTLENEAAFLIEKCDVDENDLAELERHLRSKSYLRSAKVEADESLENVTVTTWDSWSLLPTMSYGRKGNVNTYSFGIKERNLLGLGIDAEIESYKNTQRTGYKVKSTIPLFLKQNTELKIGFADNDDGQEKALFLNKNFASFHTKYSYTVGFDISRRNDSIFQNNETQSIFEHDVDYKIINFAWLGTNTDKYNIRYNVGINQDFHSFQTITPTGTGLGEDTGTLILPQDRKYTYPWLGVSYTEKDFKELTNIHLISQIEDFNHGWQLSSTLGLGFDDAKNENLAILSMDVKKGIELYDDGLLLLDISLDSDIFVDTSDRILLKVSAEYFHTLTERWGLYFANRNVFSKEQYIDRPVTIGGNTKLRGFPLQYQHGDKSTVFNSEIRYYPEINILKLFEVAGVVFYDAGMASGSSTAKNIEDGWLQSVGVGLRFYSPHAGRNSIIHLDFSFPQSSNSDIDDFSVRVEARRSF